MACGSHGMRPCCAPHLGCRRFACMVWCAWARLDLGTSPYNIKFSYRSRRSMNEGHVGKEVISSKAHTLLSSVPVHFGAMENVSCITASGMHVHTPVTASCNTPVTASSSCARKLLLLQPAEPPLPAATRKTSITAHSVSCLSAHVCVRHVGGFLAKKRTICLSRKAGRVPISPRPSRAAASKQMPSHS